MTPRKDLTVRSAPFLPPGSEIRQVFICQTAPSFAFFLITYLTGLTMFWIRYRCVAVTPDAIYVLESSKASGGAQPQSLVGTLPRRTRLGRLPSWPMCCVLTTRTGRALPNPGRASQSKAPAGRSSSPAHQASAFGNGLGRQSRWSIEIRRNPIAFGSFT
jgi:hypothetical protein